MSWETASASLQGDRKINQDRCAILQEGDRALLLLADGMGGHPRGEVAAQCLIDAGRTAFAAMPRSLPRPLDFLDRIVTDAHARIIEFGHAQHPPVDPRATAVLALIQSGHAYWIHAGDSRLYLIRDGRIARRTRDHSLVERLRRQGLEGDRDRKGRRLRNLVTHCLGGITTRLRVSHAQPARLQPGDLLLLCTDGLWGQYPEEQIGGLIDRQAPLQPVVEQLAHQATRSAAPASDNATLVALRYLHDPERPGHGAGDDLQDAIQILRGAIDDFRTNS
jgi:serine/threonine protein phosphatase PrpC